MENMLWGDLIINEFVFMIIEYVINILVVVYDFV